MEFNTYHIYLTQSTHRYSLRHFLCCLHCWNTSSFIVVLFNTSFIAKTSRFTSLLCVFLLLRPLLCSLLYTFYCWDTPMFPSLICVFFIENRVHFILGTHPMLFTLSAFIHIFLHAFSTFKKFDMVTVMKTVKPNSQKRHSYQNCVN